jgi:hypothetical protein
VTASFDARAGRLFDNISWHYWGTDGPKSGFPFWLALSWWHSAIIILQAVVRAQKCSLREQLGPSKSPLATSNK